MNEMSLRERMLIEAGFVIKKRDDGDQHSNNHGRKSVPGQSGRRAHRNGSRQPVDGNDIGKTYAGNTTKR